MRRFNLLSAECGDTSERPGYEWRGAQVARAVGAEQIGARLYELEDGQRIHPYHFHHGIEEWLLVVAGSPMVRTADGEHTLRPGDVQCFPVGADGGHEVTGPGTVLMICDRRELDSVEYPESGKIAVYPPGKVFRSADAVEIWEGE